MSKPCSICTHAKRKDIDQLLLSGTSYRDIAGQYRDVSKSALERHKPHISQALVEAKKAESVSDAGDLLGQVRGYLEKTDGIFRAVSEGSEPDHRVALMALREAREYLKLLLEVQGQLPVGGQQVTAVAIYLPSNGYEVVSSRP